MCDSYNLWHTLENIVGGELKEAIMKLGGSGGALFIRPDSGDPVEVLIKVRARNCE